MISILDYIVSKIFYRLFHFGLHSSFNEIYFDEIALTVLVWTFCYSASNDSKVLQSDLETNLNEQIGAGPFRQPNKNLFPQ